MNNNNKKQGEFLKENGLLVGLYSVVGVLVVTAGVLTVKSIEPTPISINEGEPVNTSITQSYNEEQIGDSLYTNTPNFSEETPASDVVTNSEPSIIVTYEDKIIDSNALEITATDYENNFANNDAVTTTTTSELSDGASDDFVYEPAQDVATVAMYTAYNEGDSMEWPVVGEVVLPYSNLLAIYDPTLEQFRTNELISIQSTVGQDVKASAEGQVVEVSSNEVNGNYVTIQHGNGWTTTYGQLDSAVSVKVGDVVDAGFIIGKTAKPTKYSVALGDHVDFKVTHNDVTVNPTTILASN